MQTTTLLRQYGLIVFFILLLISYILFPSAYLSISQLLLTPIYQRIAETDTTKKIGEITLPQRQGDMIPLFVIARPPQTPYDFLITTIPRTPNTSELISDDLSEYVYSEDGLPIGYIYRKNKSTYTIAMFSSPISRETFSINDYSAIGKGLGAGSFSVQVPADIEIEIGTKVIHQPTGKVVGNVISVDKISEQNIQIVHSAINSPLLISTVFTAKENGTVDTENIPLISEKLEKEVQQIIEEGLKENDV